MPAPTRTISGSAALRFAIMARPPLARLSQARSWRMGRTVERSLYDNVFGKFHRAPLGLHSSNWNPRSRVARATTLAPALLQSRRPGVGFCYLATPRNEVGRGIVAINDERNPPRPRLSPAPKPVM